MEELRFKIRYCPLAEQHHKQSLRQYAHTGHYKDTVCVCKAFWYLPDSHFYGVLAHEIGHIISNGGEEAADRTAEELFGVKILYRTSKAGKDLEYLKAKDIISMRKMLKIS